MEPDEGLSTEEIHIIRTFKESNPTMGVKKLVDGLRGQIPLINGKMVRSVEVPRPEAASAAAEQPEAITSVPEKEKPKKSRPKRRGNPSGEPSATLSFHNDSNDVDVTQGDQKQHIMFEMLQMQISFGSKEAVWSLWNMLKKARTETPGGEARISDLAIAQQLTAEFGINPMDVDNSGMKHESGDMDLTSVTRLFQTMTHS
ncbi:hypothetical protein DFH08DRAFT_936613 [Mycena albidolilacea]|uniref:Uncharacterized protein n=1 Tax=Mycena albidolilacea TaxID=1033008 RepID=A0AAD7A1Z5_9AGAR|nr:hypothetical protein DFH08DRAFT_936613 [Mycena albidolilacea]